MHVARINMGLSITMIGTKTFILMDFLMHVARINMGLSITIIGTKTFHSNGFSHACCLNIYGVVYNYHRNKNLSF